MYNIDICIVLTHVEIEYDQKNQFLTLIYDATKTYRINTIYNVEHSK
jgi:hypothetical protein